MSKLEDNEWTYSKNRLVRTLGVQGARIQLRHTLAELKEYISYATK